MNKKIIDIDNLDNLVEMINELSIDFDIKLVLLPFLEKLKSIYHTGCYIALKNNQIIDAYLNIGKGILLNVEKDLTEEDNIIIYAYEYKLQNLCNRIRLRRLAFGSFILNEVSDYWI